MMDKEKLRKADFFSGSLIIVFGLFVVTRSLAMPMKDSWGGVQNVWYVSPAIFPLFVGCMLVILGAMLIRTALKTIGFQGVAEVFTYLFGTPFRHYLQREDTVRFYGIALLLFSFVFLMIPRVDFFLAAIAFLLAFFSMFYLHKEGLLVKIMFCYGAGMILLVFLLLVAEPLSKLLRHPADWFTICFLCAYTTIVQFQISGNDLLKKKFRTALIIAVVAPVIVGVIFKYFLLVPMPCEGLIVELLDLIWYAEIWG